MKKYYRWWLLGAMFYALLGLWILGLFLFRPFVLVRVISWLWPLDILWFLITFGVFLSLLKAHKPLLYLLFPGYYLLSYLLVGFEIFFFPQGVFFEGLFFLYLLLSSIFELVVSLSFLMFFLCQSPKKHSFSSSRAKRLSRKKRASLSVRNSKAKKTPTKRRTK